MENEQQEQQETQPRLLISLVNTAHFVGSDGETHSCICARQREDVGEGKMKLKGNTGWVLIPADWINAVEYVDDLKEVSPEFYEVP